MSFPYQRVLDIDDALVSDVNPAVNDGKLDAERCARLHNYLVARAWMAKRQKGPEDLPELLQRGSYFQYLDEFRDEVTAEDLRSRLDPDLVTFLESTIFLGIYGENDPNLFLWVIGLEPPSFMLKASENFFDEEPEVNGKPHFITLYSTIAEMGGHTIGVVYDQVRHQVSFPFVQEYVDFVSPVEDHKEMWFPLEVLLSNWIDLSRLEKVVPQPIADWPSPAFDVWNWKSYSASQVDTAVAAFDRLTAAIESRMPAGSLLPWEGDLPLLTDAQLDRASVPESCFVRSFLTRVKKPRFTTIAPGLEVPHDASLFASQQRFTVIPHDEENSDEDFKSSIPPVLLFAATDKGRKVQLGRDSTFPFFRLLPEAVAEPRGLVSQFANRLFGTQQSLSHRDNLVPAGVYSEPINRNHVGEAEEGFKLLLPYGLRNDFSEVGPRRSDGSLVDAGSSAELFQHGFLPFGGEHRAQRLERLLDRWRELIEEGIWQVGQTGVEGNIDKFQDSQGVGWKHYWIPPDW